MVLDLRLITAAALLAGCSAGGATQPLQAETRAEPLDRARVGTRDLVLVADNGQCMLDLDGTAHLLDIAAPCRFLRIGKEGGPRSFDYGDRGTVVLIGGPPAPEADYSIDVGRTPADRCSNTGRAVIVSDGKVALSEVKISPIWFCPESAPDEKYYYGIAYEQTFAGRKTIG